MHGDELLVLRAYDPADLSAGEWWEVPGGGVEPGETTLAAAVRETAEETGYVVPPECVGPVCYTGSTTFTWLGRRHWSEVAVHVARPATRPTRGASDWQPEEAQSFLRVAWLPVADVVARQGRFFPDTLPDHLPRLLAGERIDGGFTVWN